MKDREGVGSSMEAESENTGSYAVGYAKPPVHTRFKPGQSGNPKGRQKARRTLKAVVETAFYEKVSVQTPRGVRRLAKIEALVTKVLNDGLKGDSKAIQHVMRLAKDAGLNQEVGVIESALHELHAEDQLIYDRYCRPTDGDDCADPEEWA